MKTETMGHLLKNNHNGKGLFTAPHYINIRRPWGPNVWGASPYYYYLEGLQPDYDDLWVRNEGVQST